MFEHLIIPTTHNAQRLFHGRGHAYQNFEHLNIDWLYPAVLITAYKPIDNIWLVNLTQHIATNIPQCTSILLQHRYLDKAPIDVLHGELTEQLIANENGLNFHIGLGKNQNHGLFLDMVNGRDWVRQHSKNKNVLNLFAYTCAFSVAAMAGGATKVVNIDISKSSLAKGRENHRLNKHDLSHVVFEGVDIFKSYNRLKKHGPYDLLICDPPSFQKGSVDIKRDYKKIISRIPQFMNNNSKLMLCLNSPDLDEDFLLDTVKEHCPACTFTGRIAPPSVFKEAHAGKGLKVLLFSYLVE